MGVDNKPLKQYRTFEASSALILIPPVALNKRIIQNTSEEVQHSNFYCSSRRRSFSLLPGHRRANRLIRQ